MSESAVSAKLLLVYGLARKRRSPKRPSEPRPSGTHPEEDTVERRQRSYRWFLLPRFSYDRVERFILGNPEVATGSIRKLTVDGDDD